MPKALTLEERIAQAEEQLTVEIDEAIKQFERIERRSAGKPRLAAGQSAKAY